MKCADRFLPEAGRASRADVVEGLRRGLLLGLAALAVVLPPQVRSARSASGVVAISTESDSSSLPGVRFAVIGDEPLSADARHVADWVADSRDNANRPFFIVDKKFTAVHAFDAEARRIASTPVLLGAAAGDDCVPGIGSRPIEKVRRRNEPRRPAGSWASGASTHGAKTWCGSTMTPPSRCIGCGPGTARTPPGAPGHADIDDNRISYGCINVPVAFYETYIRPVFAAQRAVVYVLPETKPVAQVFGSYDVAAAHAIAREGAPLR